MYIKNLQLNNFRNYENESFEFSDGINILSGDNAQGKTNCAEAIFYLCTGYSTRATRDKQVISYGKDNAQIEGTAVSRYGNVNVKMEFFKNESKSVKINGAPVAKIGELLGNINSVFFNPGELKLIQESPEDRRRFMDIALSQTNRSYFYSLQRYRKILNQRNNLLKEEDDDLVYSTLEVWDRQLASAAAEIIECRNLFIKQLQPFATAAHEFITDGKENLTVQGEDASPGERAAIETNLMAELSVHVEKDRILGYTTVGPHRDDLKIKVNGEDVKNYGSQGQQRTAALSLKLAELEIFKQTQGEYPVLILDDAMSELDKNRQKRLLEKVNGVQTIITCTHIDEEVFSGTEYKSFIINSGNIKRN